MDFKSTLHLPDAEATIPMKANLPTLEPSIQAIWESEATYHKLQEARKDAPSYVLHDGPPYTNSPIHIGTAMNKILKDFVLKSRQMMGFRTPYVPGFDNHGLPIEQAVMKKFAEKKITPTIPELRQACRDHAAEYLAIQRDQFKRLGVFGLWEKPYTTMDFRFEAEIVRVFRRLVEKGYVYKGLRPTLWSPTSRTALADTEIEYHDHVSKAIYVRFALKSDPNQEFSGLENVYTVIWTTTPWTIPANLACAFHPEFNYDVVKVGGDHYVILQDLVAKVAEKVGWAEYTVVKTLEGINFANVEFRHPIFDRASVAVMAEYVTTEDGTGVVHTAPSHGRDDFFTGQKYNLGVPNTVDERGVLTHEAGEFEGVFYKNCDTVVVDRLQEVGALLSVSDYHHSYPYAERDGQPVIFRATEQWFLSLEHEDLRQRMLESIQNVTWVPGQGQNRIEAMIRNRPDWCISRQRPWGVGIPVFYGRKSRVPVLDPVAIDAVADLVEQEGSDAWFIKEASDILPKGYVHPETGETEFDKETDVLDVWFDSGSTSLAVLEGNVYPEWKENWPADIYLEGSDQHRGWFNTSLILGQATRDGAPYKTVLTHGFVTDGEGRKMSKRLGNVIDPVKACADYGADVVRYWVAGTDYANDVPCSDPILKQFGENYRNIRNVLRFLIGNLKGFRPSDHSVALQGIDAWIVDEAKLLTHDCLKDYQEYRFSNVMSMVYNFSRYYVSSMFADFIKDRMYCDAEDSPRRRASQTASYLVAVNLVKLIAPILPHTAEETWLKLLATTGQAARSLFFEEFATETTEYIERFRSSEYRAILARVWSFSRNVNSEFESVKATSDLKNSQDAVLVLMWDPEYLGGTSRQIRTAIESFDLEDLLLLFRVAEIESRDKIAPSERSDLPVIEFRKSSLNICARSRVRRPDVAEVEVEGEKVFLSARDRKVLGL